MRKGAGYILVILSVVCVPFMVLHSPAECSQPYFTDISTASGLDFVHFNGMSGEYYFPEMTGQGCGLLDYDNDGDLDVYLLQGCMLGPNKSLSDAMFPPRDTDVRDRLYRNDLTVGPDGKSRVTFTEVTTQSGLDNREWGMGIATGDFNNDGWADIYITNYGPNRMWFNNGDGTFRDVTQQSGTGDDRWGASAAAFDYDRDGWLDLYVTNYVVFDVAVNKKCYAKSSSRDYCGPSAFTPERDRFFRNRGDGTFEDVTAKILVNYEAGPGLGIVTGDFNNDGWIDFYVANDGKPNQLWINEKGIRFVEDALFRGAAMNQDGQSEASMGIDAGDIDADGSEDLIMTHIMSETNTLFINDGTGTFEDRSIAWGLSAASFPYTSFGTGFRDYDNDGWLDLFVFSGAVLVIESLALQGDRYPLDYPNQLFRNEAGKRFVEVSEKAGPDFLQAEVSRGAAFGDIDNDGDIDVLVANNNGHVRLYRNNVGQNAPWIGLRLVDPSLKRDMQGTRVVIKRSGKPPLIRRVRTEGSYCAAQDPRILVGLGDGTPIESVDITWPDGTTETWRKPLPGVYTTLLKGAVP